MIISEYIFLTFHCRKILLWVFAYTFCMIDCINRNDGVVEAG